MFLPALPSLPVGRKYPQLRADEVALHPADLVRSGAGSARQGLAPTLVGGSGAASGWQERCSHPRPLRTRLAPSTGSPERWRLLSDGEAGRAGPLVQLLAYSAP